MTATLLTGGRLLDHPSQPHRDLFAVGGVIAAHREGGEADDLLAAFPGTEEIDVSDLGLLPGLVDGHLHVLGGGGGNGPASRIPEIPFDAVLEAGVTSCVGMPGVDVVTRPPVSLIARARAMSDSGVRTVVMAGGFRWPPPTLVGTLLDDIALVPDIVGVKIAIDEPMATAPTSAELARLLTELFWLRSTTGKACLLHAHLGTRSPASGVIGNALDIAGVPADLVQVTHANYASSTLDLAVELGRRGTWVDVNPLLHPGRVAGAVPPPEAIATLIDAGIPSERITVSSDGNASMPRVRPDGTVEAFSFQLGLLDTVRDVAERGILPLPAAIALVTRNPATALRMAGAGTTDPGSKADVVAVDNDLRVRVVVSGGLLAVRDGSAVSPSTYRDPRWPA